MIVSTLKSRFLVCTLLLSLNLAEPAQAKPMQEATAAEACNSQSIVEAEYRSYRAQELLGKISYQRPPVAQFRVIKTLHGKATPNYILVRFDFDDGSSCLAPENWNFSSELMPEEKSRWILFLNPIEDTPTWFQTYRGTYGRMRPGTKASEVLEQCQSKQ